MTDLIRVIVCIPSIRIQREIAVSPKMMVSDLKKYLPNPDFELVFQGGMLFGHHTLDSCAVRNGAYLIAVSKTTESTAAWIRLTANDDAFAREKRPPMSPEMVSEYARLTDLKMTRISGRPGMEKRLEELFLRRRELPQPVYKTVIGERPEKPCEEQMPFIWHSAV